MINIGFMQGRLVQKYNGRYQAFHPELWKEEFKLAPLIGLSSIEIIADFENEDLNPIFQNESSLNLLKKLSEDSGIKVLSVCADYFMKYNLIDKTSFKLDKKSFDVMKKLIENSAFLGIKNIVIPFVDESSVRYFFRNHEFIKSIKKVISVFEEFEVEASFELDLAPDEVLDFINNINSNKAKINYDIGNSASLGYCIEDELKVYGHLINDIHLKDRIYRGGPIIFGEGAANFKPLFDYIHSTRFKGPIIMQSFRDEQGFDIFNKQLNWIKKRYI